MNVISGLTSSSKTVKFDGSQIKALIGNNQCLMMFEITYSKYQYQTLKISGTSLVMLVTLMYRSHIC